MSTWFGSTWQTLAFVAASTTSIYLTMVVCVRLAGRRTVAQMSAFDAVITVALGSLLASTAVSSEVSYLEGTVALVVLLVLQVLVAAVRQRFASIRRQLEFSPEIVCEDGRVTLPTGLGSSQMTLDELRSALRKQGVVEPSQSALVVLEPDGKVSVLVDRGDAEAARRHLRSSTSEGSERS